VPDPRKKNLGPSPTRLHRHTYVPAVARRDRRGSSQPASAAAYRQKIRRSTMMSVLHFLSRRRPSTLPRLENLRGRNDRVSAPTVMAYVASARGLPDERFKLSRAPWLGRGTSRLEDGIRNKTRSQVQPRSWEEFSFLQFCLRTRRPYSTPPTHLALSPKPHRLRCTISPSHPLKEAPGRLPAVTIPIHIHLHIHLPPLPRS